MIGTIYIEGLKVRCVIGVYPEERRSMQELSIDLTLKIDITKCMVTDSLSDTVDYEKVSQCCHDFFAQQSYFLLEKSTYEILCELLRKFPLLSAKIKLSKQGALCSAQNTAFELEMERL